MAISKLMLRKMHGVPEPTDEADPAVTARLKYHVAAARWCDKWISCFYYLFALIGFTVVMLPVMLKSWGAFIQNTAFLSKIFHDYSTYTGLAMINIFTLVFIFFVRQSLIKNIPGGMMSVYTYRDVMEMELYPRTKKEELAYCVSIAFDVAKSTVPIFLPFGIIANTILLNKGLL